MAIIFKLRCALWAVMIWGMFIDPIIPSMAGVALVILVMGLVLKRLRQPHVVAYILVGVVLGPSVFGAITETASITRVGAIGVLLLMFFIGMELPVENLIRRWQAPVFGTTLQIVVSVLCVWVVGYFWDWPLQRVFFLGFVISMSSTAVLLQVLRGGGDLNKPIGMDVISITVAQDIAVVPMLIILALFAGESPSAGEVSLQVVGGLAVMLGVVWVIKKGRVNLPMAGAVKSDPELQVFAALALCFGLAFATGLLRLSSALGAFVAGILVASTDQTEWVRRSMDPFRVVFVGLFFLSVGLLIDVRFLLDHWAEVAFLVGLVYMINTLINGVLLRWLGHPWRSALYGGALLAQIGEFSFVLGSVGYAGGIITAYGYSMSIAVISMSLLLSPAWIALMRRMVLQEGGPAQGDGAGNESDADDKALPGDLA